MKETDAIPELIVMERSRRQTAELCNDQAGRLHCTLTKGHDGKHECLAMPGRATWDSKA